MPHLCLVINWTNEKLIQDCDTLCGVPTSGTNGLFHLISHVRACWAHCACTHKSCNLSCMFAICAIFDGCFQMAMYRCHSSNIFERTGHWSDSQEVACNVANVAWFVSICSFSINYAQISIRSIAPLIQFHSSAYLVFCVLYCSVLVVLISNEICAQQSYAEL